MVHSARTALSPLTPCLTAPATSTPAKKNTYRGLLGQNLYRRGILGRNLTTHVLGQNTLLLKILGRNFTIRRGC